jgi:hypothetical protein
MLTTAILEAGRRSLDTQTTVHIRYSDENPDIPIGFTTENPLVARTLTQSSLSVSGSSKASKAEESETTADVEKKSAQEGLAD